MSDVRNPGTGMGSSMGQPHGIPRPQGTTPPHQPGLRPPTQQPGIRPPSAPAPTLQPRPAPPKPVNPIDEPVALVEELDEVAPAATTTHAPPTASKIKFGPDVGHKHHEWKRKPHVTGTGAIRVKSFHAKYSDQGIDHLDDAINEWLDEHPEVEVKFCTQTVHVFEGKIREPALVMNVWY